MPNAADILWFKQNFQPQIEAAIAGTPFTIDLLVADRLPGDRPHLVAAAQETR